MTDDPDRAELVAALDSLVERVRTPGALEVRAAGRLAVEQAVERARARVLSSPEPVLTVALAGGTGVGKSTLINALAGSEIAETSHTRPTTTKIRVYHHHAVREGGLPQDLGAEALLVAHDREELRMKVLVDTPDLDSFVIGHRAATRRLLKAAGLVLYVFSPEKYLEERTWSILREEHCFSASAAVLNKADRVPPDELEKLTEDLRRRFDGIGLGDIKVFRVCAGGQAPPAAVDEMPALGEFLECELREGEIARLIRGQREQVVAHLAAEVDRIAPSSLLSRLREVSDALSRRADAAAGELGQALAERLGAIEGELGPLAVLEQHQRFRGPFRTWLSIADFFRYGLTGIVQRLLGRAARGESGHVHRILGRGATGEIEDQLRAQSRGIQDELYERGLPVRGWTAISGETAGADVAAEIADEIEARFDVRAIVGSGTTGAIAWIASLLGMLVPAGLVGYALYLMGSDFLEGTYSGLSLFGHLLGVVILFFVILHGVVALLLPGVRGLGRGVGKQAIRAVMGRKLVGWIRRYGEGLEQDVSALREPLDLLRSWVEAGPVVKAAAPDPEPTIANEAPASKRAPDRVEARGKLAARLREAAARGRSGKKSPAGRQ